MSPAPTPVTPNHDHEAMLASADPKLAANKRLVYDWLREVFEAGRMELAPMYMAEHYIQHNPNVPGGLQGFVEFFARIRQPAEIQPRAKTPLVAIMAEGDLVITAAAREFPDPQDATKKYTTTWFDMFRIENGRIAEHWDGALKNPPARSSRSPRA